MFLPGTDSGLVDLVAGDMAWAPPEVGVFNRLLRTAIEKLAR